MRKKCTPRRIKCSPCHIERPNRTMAVHMCIIWFAHIISYAQNSHSWYVGRVVSSQRIRIHIMRDPSSFCGGRSVFLCVLPTASATFADGDGDCYVMEHVFRLFRMPQRNQRIFTHMNTLYVNTEHLLHGSAVDEKNHPTIHRQQQQQQNSIIQRKNQSVSGWRVRVCRWHSQTHTHIKQHNTHSLREICHAW